MYKIALYTLGCKVSQYETEAIAERFAERGCEIVDFRSSADAYIINTCTVTAESDRKSRQVIRRAIAKNPSAVVAAIGCYTQRAPEDASMIEGVDVVIGTQDKLAVVDRVLDALGEREPKQFVSVPPLDGVPFEEMTVTRSDRTRAYIKIEDGCEAKCSYCAISGARGPVRSKSPEAVVAEVRGLVAGGTSEVVLTGIETGSYGRDFDYPFTLADLILLLDKEGIPERIRLGSLAPELIGEEFCEKLRGVTRLCPHFHLSLQSGSSRILGAMRRRYNRDMALANIRRLRETFPTAQFTTDLMVGFPGETEDDFSETMSVVSEVGFIDTHVFAYSKRRGTPAADYPDQVDEATKKERSHRLIAESHRVREEVLSRIVCERESLNCILETYRDGVYTAHSDEFAEVSVAAPAGLEGTSVKVRPVSHKDGVILGELI